MLMYIVPPLALRLYSADKIRYSVTARGDRKGHCALWQMLK